MGRLRGGGYAREGFYREHWDFVWGSHREDWESNIYKYIYIYSRVKCINKNQPSKSGNT